MEYLVRSLAAAWPSQYIRFEYPEHPQAAACAMFQAFCVECFKEIPAEGPSVTFRAPSLNPGEAVTYLTTVHLGKCATAVQRRIKGKSR